MEYVDLARAQAIKASLEEGELPRLVAVRRRRVGEVEGSGSVRVPVILEPAADGQLDDTGRTRQAVVVRGQPVGLAARAPPAVSQKEATGQVVGSAVADATINRDPIVGERARHMVSIREHPRHVYLRLGQASPVREGTQVWEPAVELTQMDLEILKTTIHPDKIRTVWVSDNLTTDIAYDKKVPGLEDIDASVDKLRNMLYEEGIIFQPW